MSPANRLVFRPLGWVAYAVTAVVSAIGENKLMPLPDCACKVINGRTGYVRDNSSWIIGRIVRDFESWMDDGKRDGRIRTHLRGMLDQRWEKDKLAAENKKAGSGKDVARPSQAGLCVSIYKADRARPGYPGYDLVYFIGFATTVFQLGIAAIPCGMFGDWGIFLVTTSGILLSFATGSISQWSKEKWACRRNSGKTVILTRGNGSQHAVVIIGDGKGLDLEDLAAGPTNVDVSASYTTRIAVTLLAAFWILLLITAAGIKQNTWFLLAIGGIGILQNIFVAGWRRFPRLSECRSSSTTSSASQRSWTRYLRSRRPIHAWERACWTLSSLASCAQKKKRSGMSLRNCPMLWMLPRLMLTATPKLVQLKAMPKLVTRKQMPKTEFKTILRASKLRLRLLPE